MSNFDSNGNYNKTNWKTGDKITADKLNKIEDSLEVINNNDISRHQEADARLDALEAGVVANKQEIDAKVDALEDTVISNKDAADLDIYRIDQHMTLLDKKIDDGVAEVYGVAETVDGKIAEVDASMKAMVAEVESDLEGLHAKDEELSEQIEQIVSITKTNYLNVVEAIDRGFTIDEITTECKSNGYIFYIANGDVLNIDKTLNLRHIKVIIEGTVNVNFNGVGLIIGSSSTSPMSFKTYIYAITHTNYQDGDISVQIQGVLNGDIEIQYARKVKLWADGNDSTIDAISYSKFTLGTIYNLEINSNKNAGNIGWITECIFYGGRYTNILIDGNFPHEELIFIKPCLENGILTMNQGVNCRFIHMRNEDSSGDFSRFKINLGEKTHGNRIELGAVESGWSTLYMTDHLKSVGSIVDNGRENAITNQIAEQYKDVTIFNIIANVTLKKNWCKYNLPNADVDKIILNNTLMFIDVKNYASFFKKTFPIGSIKRFKIVYDGINDYGDNVGRGWNVTIQCYDKSKNLITKQSISSLNIIHFEANGSHTFSYPVEGTKHFLITNNDVHYIKMNIYAQGDSKIIKVKNISLSMYCNHNDENQVNILKSSIERNVYRSGFLSKSSATDIETLRNDYNKLIDMLFLNGVIGELQTVGDMNYTDYNALEKFYSLDDI